MALVKGQKVVVSWLGAQKMSNLANTIPGLTKGRKYNRNQFMSLVAFCILTAKEACNIARLIQ